MTIPYVFTNMSTSIFTLAQLDANFDYLATTTSVPTVYSVGSYLTGRPANTTNYAPGDTIAGSILVAAPSSSWYYGGVFWIPGDNTRAVNSTTIASVGSGTWRCFAPSYGTTLNPGGKSAIDVYPSTLWARIA